MVLAQRLRELRLQNKLTLEEVARGTKVEKSQIFKYEKSLVKPSVEALTKLCQFYGISADYLLFEKPTEIAKKTKIHDTKLLQLFYRIDRANKPQRDRIKWVIANLLDDKIDLAQLTTD